VGRPDSTWGQVVHAFVVTKSARKPLPQELIAYCRGRLAGFKLPRRVHLVPSLPRTPSGKLRREELRGDA
jgi:acyl-CoA synthetase (AMP-forming)/AMP-acid ligase II